MRTQFYVQMKDVESGNVIQVTYIAFQSNFDHVDFPFWMFIFPSIAKKDYSLDSLYAVSRCRTRDESEDHTSEKACKGSTLPLNQGRTSPEVQNRSISGPMKRSYVLQSLKKEKLFNFKMCLLMLFGLKHLYTLNILDKIGNTA